MNESYGAAAAAGQNYAKTATPREPTPLELAHSGLDENICRFDALLEKLEDRLRGALTPQYEAPTAPANLGRIEAAPPPISTVVARANALAQSAYRSADRLAALIHRIEV